MASMAERSDARAILCYRPSQFTTVTTDQPVRTAMRDNAYVASERATIVDDDDSIRPPIRPMAETAISR